MARAEQLVGPGEAHDELLGDLPLAVGRPQRAGDLDGLLARARHAEQPRVGGDPERVVGRVDRERADDRELAVGVEPRHGELRLLLAARRVVVVAARARERGRDQQQGYEQQAGLHRSTAVPGRVAIMHPGGRPAPAARTRSDQSLSSSSVVAAAVDGVLLRLRVQPRELRAPLTSRPKNCQVRNPRVMSDS